VSGAGCEQVHGVLCTVYVKAHEQVYFKVPCVNEGVTQELIDETRLSTENEMLADLQKLVEEGGSLECRGDHGETAVCCGLS